MFSLSVTASLACVQCMLVGSLTFESIEFDSKNG